MVYLPTRMVDLYAISTDPSWVKVEEFIPSLSLQFPGNSAWLVLVSQLRKRLKFSNYDMCVPGSKLNSHYFYIIGDKLINPSP